MNLSRVILTNTRKVTMGMINIRARFIGNGESINKKKLRKDSKTKKIGIKMPQKIPPALSRNSVLGIFKTIL
jgi:hypothetical protein